MIGEANRMIAGCIDKMKRDACGGCERRDACAHLFGGLFGPAGAFSRPAEPRPERPAPRRGSFLAFLGQVAQAIESGKARAAPKPAPSALRSEIERRIEPLLASGDGVRIEQMARELGLGRQTLYRRLKAEGTTFEALLDGVRRRVALRLIRNEGLSVKEAAYRLGFSDPAAFSRAFKRWTGASPSKPN